MKRPGRLMRILPALGALAVFIAAFLLYSETGLRWVLRAALSSAPGDLTVGAVEGRLLGPVRLRGVQFEHEGNRVSIGVLRLDWRPAGLLGGEVSLSLLEAGDIRIEVAGKPPPEARANDAPFELADISLPVSLALERLALRDITILTTAGEAPFQLDWLTAALFYDRQSLVLKTLEMEGPQLSLTATGQVEPLGGYPLRAGVDYKIRAGDLPEVAGRLEVSGNLERLNILQSLDRPARTELTVRIENPLERPVWSGRMTLGRVNLADLNPRWESLAFEGAVQGHGTLQSYAIEAELAGDYQNEQWQGDLLARYENSEWRVDRLALNLPRRDASMELQGTVLISGTRQRVDVEGGWRNLAWPLQGEPLLVSPAGRLRLSGALDAYRFGVEGRVEGPGIPPGQWSLAGTGTPQGVELQQLQGDVLDGRVNATAAMRWAPEPQWRFAARAQGLNPGMLWKGAPEALDFSLQGDGALQAGAYVARVRLEELSGMLRGAPLSGWGNMEMTRHGFSMSPLVLAAGESHLVVAGGLDEQWSMSWRVEAPDVQRFYPPAAGRIESSGSISGLRENPAIAAVLKGQGLAYGTNQVAHAVVNLDWDPSNLHASRLDIHLVDVETGGRQIRQLDIRGTGRAARHTVHLWVDTARAQLTGRITGAYEEAAWQGAVAGIRLILPSAGIWRSTEPALIRAARDHFSLKPWCLSGEGDARVCLDGYWQGGTVGEGNVRAENLSLGIVGSWLPADISISGLGNLKAHVRSNALGQVGGDAEFFSPEGLLAFEVTREDEVRLTYRDFQVKSNLLQGMASLSVTADLGAQGGVNGQLQLPVTALNPRSREVRGEFEANLREFGMLSLLIPEAENIQGELQARARVTGTVEDADIDVDIDFSKGGIDFPAQGIAVNGISLRVQSAAGGRNTLVFQGGANSGKGRISARGSFKPGLAHDWRLDVDVEGKRFEVMNTPEYQVLVSPSLTLAVNHDAAWVSGVVRIPQAVLRPRTLSGAVRPSRDAVIVSGNDRESGKGFAVTSEVRIQLGDSVRFDGFGLKGYIAGELLVKDTPGQLTSGRGELSIQGGTFKAYGQDLIIERGRLVFVGGPIDTPGLDIRAIRKVEDVTVGLNVSGDVIEPRLSIFSSPAMSETEALSYLLLGRPLERDETGKDKELSGAALALGVGGASLFGKKLGEGLGIDEVNIETKSGTGEIRLKMGTYLSPKLYVGYSRSLAEQLNIYMVRYRLSKNLTVSGESSSEAVGGDLLWTIEKD